MPVRRKLLMVVAPLAGAAAVGAVLGFSVPAMAASPSPSPSASSQQPSDTAPAQGGQSGNAGQSGQGHCPNM